MVLFYYGLGVLLFWLVLTLYALYGRSRMKYLKNVVVDGTFEEPAVAIIIAVRNEEAHLAQALQSVIGLQYSRYRIVVINDRSTDGTPAILARIAAQHPHINLLTVTQLPEGWLGKNHALYSGYKATTEEWMLFADADVVFEPNTLQKAVRYCKQNNLHHLTVLPEVESPSKLLNSLLATFLILLEIRQRPWAVRDPSSKASLGVGAFNLVQRRAYEKAGTHTAIALRPDDDLKLGERIKASRGRQDALYGSGQIGLEWYSSVKDFVAGLMKNSFSVFDYNLAKLLATGVLPLLLLLVLPLPLLLAGGTPERLMAAALLLLSILLFTQRGGMRTHWWYALMVPVAGALMTYILLKAAITTLRQGGIYWRDSFYPLRELKKAK